MIQLMPDEFVYGAIGRYRKLTDVPRKRISKFDICCSLNKGYLEKQYSFTAVQTLAKEFCIDEKTLLLKHSFLPFFSAIRTGYTTGDVQSRFEKYKQSHLWLSAPSGKLRACQNCVTSDINDFGFSYWRRSHQLPGLIRCHRHRTPIERLAGDAGYHSPAEIIKSCKADQRQRIIPDDIYQAYEQLTIGVLESPACNEPKDILRSIFHAAGIEIENLPPFVLERLILEKLKLFDSTNWTHDIYITTIPSDKGMGGFLGMLRRTCIGESFLPNVYILIASLMLQNRPEAARLIFN